MPDWLVTRTTGIAFVLAAEITAAALDIDMARSWLVGDRAGDVEAARRAGLAGALHVLTGHGQAERAAALALSGPRFEVRGAASIADALTLPLFDRA